MQPGGKDLGSPQIDQLRAERLRERERRENREKRRDKEVERTVLKKENKGQDNP